MAPIQPGSYAVLRPHVPQAPKKTHFPSCCLTWAPQGPAAPRINSFREAGVQGAVLFTSPPLQIALVLTTSTSLKSVLQEAQSRTEKSSPAFWFASFLRLKTHTLDTQPICSRLLYAAVLCLIKCYRACRERSTVYWTKQILGILFLPLTSCVTLGKLLNLSDSSLFVHKHNFTYLPPEI